MTTYSRQTWEEAQAAWAAGEFSDEWATVRELAARRGMLYPPSGSKWDSWEDSPPSQRAILIRAIRDTPELLGRCIERSSSWSGVIEALLGAITAWREEVAAAEAEDARRRREEQGGRLTAPARLADILDRVRP